MPLAPHKTVLPTTMLTFLGIYINTVSRQLSIPQQKIDEFLTRLERLLVSKSNSIKDLQSLTGKLNFCCYILLAGRAFLRRTYDLTIHPANDQFIPLNSDTIQNLKIWKDFLLNFNSKIYKINRPLWSPSFIHLYSDASKSGF